MKTSKEGTPIPDDTCPTCGKQMKKSRAKLSVRIHAEEVAIGGIPHFRCPGCDERLIGLQRAKDLRLQANASYRKEHRLLSSSEIQALREDLGLTQAQLAEFLQLGANTISRWEAGRLVQSASMDILLRLIRDIPQNIQYLHNRAA